MSSNWSEAINYKCFNDCRMEGCPGHQLQIEYFNTADTVNLFIDGELRICFDDNQFEALLRAALDHKAMPHSVNERTVKWLESVLERAKG